jgi:hypothetical protein
MCIRDLEEEQARMKAVSEEEARRRQAEEDALVLEKHELEASLARVKVVVPLVNSPAFNVSAFDSPGSIRYQHANSLPVTSSAAAAAHSASVAAHQNKDGMNPMANCHEGHSVEEAERELDPWFRQIGFAEDDAKILVLRFSKPDFGVTNCALMFSLEDEDVDVILDGCPLGHKRAIKRALKKGKNA